MIDAKNIPASIQWHEGMLLAPQHFQQSSIRQEELLHYHMAAFSPFYWGIKWLKIDQVLLIEGLFRVLEIEAIMPDGLIVYHQHPDDKNLEIDLTQFVEQMKSAPLTVQLVVPVMKTGSASIKGDLVRYDSVEGIPVPDENTGESELAVPRLKPRINLIATETPPQKYTSFPIAKITYKNEKYTLTDYIPPTLIVSLKSYISEICSSIAQRIREKAVFLSEKVGSPTSAVHGPMVLETKMHIQSMVSALPYFETVLNTGVSHPFSLYLSLCHIVGNMAALGQGLIPPVLPVYNHNDILSNFEQAKDFVFRMMDEGILESHTAVMFDLEKEIFSLKLDSKWIDPSLVIGVRRKTDTTEKDVIDWMDECLIGSIQVIESLRKKRILGAEREKIEGDEELIPARGVTLFSIKTDPDFILPDKILQIFNTSDPKGKLRPTEMTLYVRNVS